MIFNQFCLSFDIAATAVTMLEELIQVTHDNLLDKKGPMRALCAIAQRINAFQKVELSIRCVFSMINMHWNYFTTSLAICSEGLKSKFNPFYLIYEGT